MEFVQNYVAPTAEAIIWISGAGLAVSCLYVFIHSFVVGMIEDHVKAKKNELIVNQIVEPRDNVVSITSLSDARRSSCDEVFDQEADLEREAV